MADEPLEIVPTAFCVEQVAGERPGACASFPYDRALVRRFRKAFPRARWRENHWFVPGVRAAQRLNMWVAREISDLDRHADAKGRDDYVFEPLESPYLEVGDELVVRTPYSRSIVAAMRAIPWARWDFVAKVWRVPFRSYAALRACWPEIEAAARRREQASSDESPPDPGAKRRQAERRRRRYPVPIDDPPPSATPVATRFGIVLFEATSGELVDADAAQAFPFVADSDCFVWAQWRLPNFRELRAVRPAVLDPRGEARGWWVPTERDIEAGLEMLRRAERRRRPPTPTAPGGALAP